MSARVVVLGAGAAGLSAANRLAAQSAGTEIVVVDRAGEHVFWPGLTGVLFGDAQPAAIRRPVASLLASGVRLVTGQATRIDPAASRVLGSFGELPYDYLVVALVGLC